MSGLENTICHTFTSEFEKIYNLVAFKKDELLISINGVKSTLNVLTFSSTSVIDSKISELQNQINDSLPVVDPDFIDNINNIISGCSFLSDNAFLSNPSMLMKRCTDGLFSNLGSALSSLSSGAPEFGVAKLISDLEDIIGAGDGIAARLAKLDKIIDCASALCGSEFSSAISGLTSDVNSLYSTLGIESDPVSSNYGKLDLQSIYSDVGLSVSEITNMNSIMSAVDSAKTSITSAIADTTALF